VVSTPGSVCSTADYHEVDFAWFSGGRLNAFVQLYRPPPSTHAPIKRPFIWVQERARRSTTHITYRELKHHVCRVANVLLQHGVRKGRSRLHLPDDDAGARVHDAGRAPESGAAHSVVFWRLLFLPFSAEIAWRDDRIPRCAMPDGRDRKTRGCGADVAFPLKKTVDQAIEGVSNRGTRASSRDGRTPTCRCEPAAISGWMRNVRNSESTSTCAWMGGGGSVVRGSTRPGSTGKPKGLLHTTGGYLVLCGVHPPSSYSITTPGDIYFFAPPDIGWITGQQLHRLWTAGPTVPRTVLFESTPRLSRSRPAIWQVVDDPQGHYHLHGANRLACAPSATMAMTGSRSNRPDVLCAFSAPWGETHQSGGCGAGITTGSSATGPLRGGRHVVAERKRGGILITYFPCQGVTPTKPGSGDVCRSSGTKTDHSRAGHAEGAGG